MTKTVVQSHNTRPKSHSLVKKLRDWISLWGTSLTRVAAQCGTCSNNYNKWDEGWKSNRVACTLNGRAKHQYMNKKYHCSAMRICNINEKLSNVRAK